MDPTSTKVGPETADFAPRSAKSGPISAQFGLGKMGEDYLGTRSSDGVYFAVAADAARKQSTNITRNMLYSGYFCARSAVLRSVIVRSACARAQVPPPPALCDGGGSPPPGRPEGGSVRQRPTCACAHCCARARRGVWRRRGVPRERSPSVCPRVRVVSVCPECMPRVHADFDPLQL